MSPHEQKTNNTMIDHERYNTVGIGRSGRQAQVTYEPLEVFGAMAILDENTLDFTSTSLEQTHRLGVRLGELLAKGDVICLSGELGSGKTALARGVARGWGSTFRVTSPTFTLVNEYPRLGDNCVLFHIDCYRLESPAEIVTAGLEDVLDDAGAIMIEWPERIVELLPLDRLWVSLRYLSETRRGLRFQAFGPRPELLLKEFRQSAFGV